MPLIKNIKAISYSSQDPKHPLSNVLNGTGSWLTDASDKSGHLSAELQLERATSIAYIDIGNLNSMTLSIEVSRSCGGVSMPLLPTVVLVTPHQFRTQHSASRAVRMLKTDDLDKAAVAQKWDRIRISCYQPFKPDVQFGLAFLRFYTTETEFPPVSSVIRDAVMISTVNDPCWQASASTKKVASDEQILSRLNGVKKNARYGLNGTNLTPTVKRFNTLDIQSLKNTNKIDTSQEPTLRNSSWNSNGKSSNTTTPAAVKAVTLDDASANRLKFLAKLKVNSAATKASSTSLQSPEVQRLRSSSSSSSDISSLAVNGAAGLAMAGSDDSLKKSSRRESAQQQQVCFEKDSLEFIISIDLPLDQIYKLNVKDVRQRFEAFRGFTLSPGERLLFRDLCGDYYPRRIKLLEREIKERRKNIPSGTVIDISDDDNDGKAMGMSMKALNWSDQSKENLGGTNNSFNNQGFNNVLQKKCNIKSKSEIVIDNLVDKKTVSNGSGKKFTFKRISQDCQKLSLSNLMTPSSKKAKFQDENHLINILPARLDQNILASPHTKSLSPKVSKVNQSHSTKKPLVTPSNTVGVWSTSKRRICDSAMKESPKQQRSRFSLNTLEVEIDDPLISDIRELDKDLRIRSDLYESQMKSSNETSSTVRCASAEGGENQEIGLNSGGAVSDRGRSNNRFSFVDRSNRSNNGNNNNYNNNKRTAVKSNQTMTRNRGSSTVVILDKNDGSSADVNVIGRTTLNSAVSIGSFSSNTILDNAGNSVPSSSNTLTSGGQLLGVVPQNKFGFRRVTANKAILSESSGNSSPDEQVECPLCANTFDSSEIEEHAEVCMENSGNQESPPPPQRSTEEAPADIPDATVTEENVCPVCQETVACAEYEDHVHHCADRHYS